MTQPRPLTEAALRDAAAVAAATGVTPDPLNTVGFPPLFSRRKDAVDSLHALIHRQQRAACTDRRRRQFVDRLGLQGRHRLGLSQARGDVRRDNLDLTAGAKADGAADRACEAVKAHPAIPSVVLAFRSC